VLDGHPAPVPEKGAEPTPLKFSAHVYCGQTAGWIKVALGTEVGLSPGDFVLDGDPAPLQKGGGPSPLPTKGAEPPLQFSANFYCAQTVRYITMPLGMYAGLSSGDFVFDRDPAPTPKRGRGPLPNFQPMSIVAKLLDGSRWHLAWSFALVQATLC